MSWCNMGIIRIWQKSFTELCSETFSFFIPRNIPRGKSFIPIILAFLLGGIGCFFHPSDKTGIPRLIWVAFIEEFTWRMLIQEQTDKFLRRKKFFSVSVSCIAASAVFAAFHLFNQSYYMALLIFFPAMVFGLLWDYYKNPYYCIAIHFWYNFTFFYLDGVYMKCMI